MFDITEHYSFNHLPSSGKELGHCKIQKRVDSESRNILYELDQVLNHGIYNANLCAYKCDEHDVYTRSDLEDQGFQAIHIQPANAQEIERPSSLHIGWADPQEIQINLITMCEEFSKCIRRYPDAIGFLLPLLAEACSSGDINDLTTFFTSFYCVMKQNSDDTYLTLLRDFRDNLEHIYSLDSSKKTIVVARDWEVMHSRLTFPGDTEFDSNTPLDGNVVWHRDYTYEKVIMLFANVDGVLMRACVQCSE